MDAKRVDMEKFKQYFHEMLSFGVYIAPSPYESSFISIAHSNQDLEETIEAIDKSFSKLRKHETGNKI